MRKLLLIICLAILPLYAQAAPLEPEAPASLTLTYQKDGAVFSDVEVGIYRVAEAFPSGEFQLIAPFSGYPVNIHSITDQTQWVNVAGTLNAYIVADGIAPDATAKTDAEGVVKFEGLKTGLYLVEQVITENDTGTYIWGRFMVYLPTPGTDGYDYAVEAKPKCTSFVPETQHSVTKLWQDDKNTRPQSVTVDIYKDGKLYETQVLNGQNDWTYSWSVSAEDKAQWTVAERDVPVGYKVTIKENGGSFSIINTAQTQPDIPLTGDSYNPLPLILILCLSGIALVILAIYMGRRK